MKYSIITNYNIGELSGGGHGLRKVIKGIESMERDASIYIYQRKGLAAEVGTQWAFRSVTKVFNYKKNFVYNVLARVFFYPGFLNLYSRQIAKSIRDLQPEVIFFVGSRFGKIYQDISGMYPPEKYKVYIQIENYELGMMENTTGVLRKLFAGIERRSIINSEKLMLQCSNFLFLTSEDRKKFESFYNTDIQQNKNYRSWLIPHCYYQDFSGEAILENIQKKFEELYTERKVTLVFTGSFYLKANIEAVLDLLMDSNKISAAFNDAGYQVMYIIAGFDAGIFSSLVSGKSDFTLIDKPGKSDLQAIMRASDIYISPIKIGAGVNTKIAEALSYGFPIIAEKYSLRGYENLLENGRDFIVDINSFSSEAARNLISGYQTIRKQAYEFYKKNYSIEVFSKLLKQIIDFDKN